jgi:hypothetical protein
MVSFFIEISIELKFFKIQINLNFIETKLNSHWFQLFLLLSWIQPNYENSIMRKRMLIYIFIYIHVNELVKAME